MLSNKETEMLGHHKAKLATTQGWNKPNRECNESRKNRLDCVRSNPKHSRTIGNQQPMHE